MGQAFRRAAGRIRGPTGVDQPPTPKSKTVIDRPPPATPTGDPKFPSSHHDPADGPPGYHAENVLEERDPQYDSMLSQMVGRIKAKPGGVAEMGEASVVERSRRPLPKLRSSTPDSGRYEDRPAPPGTLNVSQVRHIMLLYQGKADDHNGPMNVDQIAEKFRVDVAQVQRIVQFLSLPPDNTNKQNN